VIWLVPGPSGGMSTNLKPAVRLRSTRKLEEAPIRSVVLLKKKHTGVFYKGFAVFLWTNNKWFDRKTKNFATFKI
jgi:hypothetical protein